MDFKIFYTKRNLLVNSNFFKDILIYPHAQVMFLVTGSSSATLAHRYAIYSD